MGVPEVNSILQVACVSILAMVCILFIKHSKAGLNSWTGIGFTLAIICYLIVDSPIVQNSKVLFSVVVTGAITIPVFFLLLTKAIFDDHFRPSSIITVWFFIQIVPHLHIYLRDEIAINEDIRQFLFIIAEITSIGFVLAGLYTAIKTRQGDLIESRLRFRNIFIIITAALIGITLIVESIPLEQGSTELLQILQRCSILGLTLFFVGSNLDIRPGFFFLEQPKQKPAPIPADGQLRQKLETLIEAKKIYRKEGLTIRELAELMNEQEYRLRRLINGEMGFRNFNDFVNQYRVREACDILTDPKQNRKTVLEIAYALGYQSIGPFNKAFKELKNATPTAFRKANQA
jgi:AraC-like DNA-binding protein